MPSPYDRQLGPLEAFGSSEPYAPLSVSCNAGFDPQTVDVWWSNPADLSSNSQFNVIGVNLYRSFDSPYGPFTRLNAAPLQTHFFRDRTTVQVVLDEDVSNSWVVNGLTNPAGRWVFKTKNVPIVIQPNLSLDDASTNVHVTVDGVPATIYKIDSLSGQVELDVFPYFDSASERQIFPAIPVVNSIVLASYRYVDGSSKSVLNRRSYYRVTTVSVDPNGDLLETPIHKSTVTNSQEVEAMDWIWREAIRRNKFILQQGGERVKLFIRKSVGAKCGCVTDTHKQAASDCITCFATGIKHGYEGPFDVLIAPDDAEKKVEQSNRGRTVIHSYETWTGPNPLLSQRDFIVKMNGDRYGIGPVRMPSNRGNQLQQHFMISHLDEGDIRYKVQIPDNTYWSSPRTRYMDTESGNSISIITNRENIPNEREDRGNTVVWENEYRR